MLELLLAMSDQKGAKNFVSSKRINLKEYRSLSRDMAIGDIAMARGVYAL